MRTSIVYRLAAVLALGALVACGKDAGTPNGKTPSQAGAADGGAGASGRTSSSGGPSSSGSANGGMNAEGGASANGGASPSRGGSTANGGTSTNGGTSPSAIQVTVTPATARVAPEGSQKFSAKVTGSSSGEVTWTASSGSIDATGLYTAPARDGTYTVTAASKADASAKGSATVVVGVPRSCSELPAPGTWEKISPSEAAETDAVVVDPFDPATVWVGVKNGGIHKSTDCGATWTHVNTGVGASEMNSGAPGSMQVDPKKQGVMYATAFMGSNGLLKSTNGGVDWKQLFPQGSEVQSVVQYNLINSIALDVHNTDHLVVSTHAVCAAPYGPVCVMETLDGGQTWDIVKLDIGASDWVAGAGAFIIDDTTWLFGTYSAGLWLTRDNGAHLENVTPTGASGSTSGKTLIMPFVPSAGGKYYLAAMEGVLTSDDGLQWSLLPNSGGRTVGLAMGSGKVFSADQWSLGYHVANESDLGKWTVIPPPMGLGSDQGAPYLAYDEEHHLLYSSNWAGGLWRMVTE